MILFYPLGLMPETGVYTSKFSVTGSEEIDGKDVKCSYTVKDYGYTETTKIVKSYVTGELLTVFSV